MLFLCYLSIIPLQFYSNNHNDLIWFVRRNKVRVWSKSVEGPKKKGGGGGCCCCFEFWLHAGEKSQRFYFSFFCTLRQPPRRTLTRPTASVRWPFSAIATPLAPSPPHTQAGRGGAELPQLVSLNPWCHFLFGWRHVVGLWLRCMTWRWVDISTLSLPPSSILNISTLIYIYTHSLYWILAQLVECSKMTPLLATCGTWCNWRAYWLVDKNLEWPLTLCAIVLCALVTFFFFLLWGSCVWMFCISLYFFTFTWISSSFSSPPLQYFWHKSTPLPSHRSDRQLFSGAMSEVTLCLRIQLNLRHSRREHRQMLTLHSSPDSACTGSTSARLFYLPSTGIISHLFIYEGAKQTIITEL